MFKRLAPLAVLALFACHDTIAPPRRTPLSHADASANATGLTVFFSQQFLRTTGSPNQYSVAVSTSGYQAPFEIHIRNGSASGTNRVSSAWVSVDGKQLLGPGDFSQQASEWTLPIVLGAMARLDVTVASKPGSYLDITISGTPAATRFCPADVGDGASFGDFPSAIAATDPGGTIVVCDGTHIVENVTIDRPLTIVPENPGGAVLRLNTFIPPVSFSFTFAVPAGTVRFAGLRFETRVGVSIFASGVYDTVIVDSSSFRSVLAGQSGVAADRQTGPATSPLVLVRGSTFKLYRNGIFGNGASRLDAIENWVDSSTFSGIQYQNSSPVTLGSNGRIERNRVTNCGPVLCIGAATGLSLIDHIDVIDNVIENDWSRATDRGLVVSGSVTATGNQIIGLGGGGPPTLPSSYAFRLAGILMGSGIGAPSPIAANNVVTNAFHGVDFFNAASGATATDNTISNVANGAFMEVSGVTSQFHRNDVTGYVFAISRASPSFAGSFTCNWWGSASGPSAVGPGIPAAFYIPFSVAPIANQLAVVCP